MAAGRLDLFYAALNLAHPWAVAALLYTSPVEFVRQLLRGTRVALGALLYASLFDYLMGRAMEAWGRRRLWLALSIANSVALLGLFKYGPFVVENLNRLLGPCWGPAIRWRSPVGRCRWGCRFSSSSR